MSAIDSDMDFSSILDVFNDEVKNEPVAPVEVPVTSQEETTITTVSMVRNTRPNCPHCGDELSLYCGHPTVHWYCFHCMVFVRDSEIKESE